MHILYNATITTQSPEQPHATAIAIDDQKIVAVGTDEEIINGAAPGSTRENMEKAVIWPGLTDAHIHLHHYAAFLQKIDCETDTREECLRRVTKRAQQTPAGDWILGHGWNQNTWPESFGNADLLDQAAPEHPVYLTAKSLHASWANSAAMQAAGITINTPDPEGGKIGRLENGKPDGILYESAMNLVENVLPAPTVDEVSQMIDQCQPNLWKMGLTGCHDFDYRTCFSALQILHQQEKLKLRVVKGIPLENLDNALELGLRSGFGDDILRIGSIKLFADGALGPRTAAMLRPYENENEYCGFPLLDSEQIYEIGRKAVKGGFGLAIHAIGDRANHEALNAFAHLRTFEKANHFPAYRHRIEHVQILHPDDLGRLAELNVIASMQPIHAISDMFIADRHWGARAAYSYAWNTLLDANTMLVFGSDAPVESPNPFFGLFAAVTRQRFDGKPGQHGWYPEQRISLQAALDGFTLGPAYAAGLENKQGRLAPGYFADCIVLPADPFHNPVNNLYQMKPRATMFNGEWVFRS